LYICRLSRELGRVTSDCRPWKSGGGVGVCENCGVVQHIVNKTWRQEIEKIYSEYQIYHQGNGAENAIISSNGGPSTPRSQKILERFNVEIDPPSEGKILDVGCGNGTFLSQFKLLNPQWTIYGQDPNPSDLQKILSITGGTHFYQCPVEEIDDSFDLISLFHVLEHIEAPVDFLDKLKSKLNNNGIILIQTPDYEKNPFDLVVADHCSHFTPNNFARLTQSAGLVPQIISNKWLFKEITVVAATGTTKTLRQFANTSDYQIRLHSAFTWLEETVEAARRISRLKNFGIFGTSSAAIWLDGELKNKAQYFVDEDTNRINQTIFGRPVHHPDTVPKEGNVFMAIVPNQAKAITERIVANSTTYHMPPPFPFSSP